MNDHAKSGFARLCTAVLTVLFCAGFGVLLFSLCFFNNSGMFDYSTIKQLLSALCIGGTGVIFCFAARRAMRNHSGLRAFLKKHFGKLLILTLSGTFCFQMWYVNALSVPIGWDVGQIYNTAMAPDMNAEFGYFSIYPNNLFLLFCFRALFKLLRMVGIADGWLVLSILNTLFVDTAALLCVLCAKQLWGLRGGYIALAVCIASFGVFPWLIVPYSDTLAMPFTILLFYLYLQLCRAKSTPARVALAALAGIAACVGYFIKPTVIIIAIAAVLIHFIFTHTLRALCASLALLLIFSACFVGGNHAFNHFVKEQQYIRIYENQATPMTHFIMMGLSKYDWGDGNIQYGAYRGEDVSYTHANKDPDKKVEANLKMIRARLQDYGFGGYMRFLLDKARWVTAEGCFHWLGEGNFAQWEQAPDSIFKQLVTQDGKYFDLYLYYTQGLWILILLAAVLSPLINTATRRNRASALLRCTLIGILLFILIFEGRSRYLLLYLPCFLLLATEGVIHLHAFVANRRK